MKIQIGTKFHSTYADSKPEWTVIAKAGRDAWKCQIVDNGDYQGTVKLFSTREITASIGLSNFFRKSSDESANFFDSLPVGSIVHVHYGGNSFVRSEVTKDKQLRPIALVGNWMEGDLPKRSRNGEIYLGYLAGKIINGCKPYRPHASNVYEYTLMQTPYRQPGGFSKSEDPRKMKPISLEVPEMTEDEKKAALLWNKIEFIRELTQTSESNPDEILRLIKELI